ncbi:glycoside hydrolase family 71 protein [Neolentinus lepideus HHB14362 ss-1]|uniref:Glycoside hydrolase family 71 protein n=1 Tax=Neolentinus lepideus HHB14362 ss-1 TaxID=1314782 RepID=A0A165QNM6_9AGAM|nr:glycoside hydrolase family 71 protein [Neolentinus lepideus HHB14362 ss-1]
MSHFRPCIRNGLVELLQLQLSLSTSATTNQTFSVPTGVSKLDMPLTIGGYMQG